MAKPAIKVNRRDSFKAKLTRIKRLPKLKEGNRLFFAYTKGDSLRMIRAFHNGIKNSAFGLVELKDKTVRRKMRLGMELPDTPLYGAGDDQKPNSYVNMLRLRKLKNGYKVFPSKGKHYSGTITLDHLFNIHEAGAIIKLKNYSDKKSVEAKRSLVRIPPRPAFLKAFELVATEKRKKERSQKVKRVMTQYINDGRTAQFLKEIDAETRGLAKFDNEE